MQPGLSHGTIELALNGLDGRAVTDHGSLVTGDSDRRRLARKQRPFASNQSSTVLQEGGGRRVQVTLCLYSFDLDDPDVSACTQGGRPLVSVLKSCSVRFFAVPTRFY